MFVFWCATKTCTADGSLVVHDTVTGTSRPVTEMNQSRWGYGMSMLGGDALVCGGHDRTFYVLLSSCELYTTDINTWNTFPPLPVQMQLFAMLTLGQCLDCDQPFLFGESRDVHDAINRITIKLFKLQLFD